MLLSQLLLQQPDSSVINYKLKGIQHDDDREFRSHAYQYIEDEGNRIETKIGLTKKYNKSLGRATPDLEDEKIVVDLIDYLGKTLTRLPMFEQYLENKNK